MAEHASDYLSNKQLSSDLTEAESRLLTMLSLNKRSFFRK